MTCNFTLRFVSMWSRFQTVDNALTSLNTIPSLIHFSSPLRPNRPLRLPFPPPSPGTAAFLAMVNNGSTAVSAAATITPNTLSALTGVLQQHANSTRLHPLSQSTTNNNNNASPPDSAATAAANGLFLLSQAHQELTKREEAQKALSAHH